MSKDMKDLHAEALAIAALREKATPGQWNVVPHPTARDAGPWLVRPHVCYEIENLDDARLIASAHRMADLIAAQDAKIAELMAENKSYLQDGVLSRGYPASYWYRKCVEARAASNRHHARVETAEAKLRELCEMEPVAWMNPGNGHTFDHKGRDRMIENGKHGGEFAIAARLAQQFSIPVIPRPTMPESKS